MKYILFLIGLFAGFVTYAEDLATRGSGATITPTIPVSCYDGMKHTKINAIDDVSLTEDKDSVILKYRIYMVDCFFDGKDMQAKFYGPLHSGRCDQSIFPYDGVYTYSKVVPLLEAKPYGQIEVCQTQINFNKNKLKAGDNQFSFVYRHEAIGRYEWNFNINYDVTQQQYTQSMSQLPEGTIGNNLDRYLGTQGVVCNYDTMLSGNQGFGIEAPIAKVKGRNLVLSFYAVAFSCKQEDGKYQWIRDRIKTADYVIVKNSANSPVGYDWNIFKLPIDKRAVGSFLNFVMPLEEVVEPDQLALLRNGQMATTNFKVSANSPNYFGHVGFFNLVVNLDPLAVEN